MMKPTDRAAEMVQMLGDILSVNQLALILGQAQEIAEERWLDRFATFHIVEAMAEMIAGTDPMAPDCDALAAEEPTSQNGDSRDGAEVAGAQ